MRPLLGCDLSGEDPEDWLYHEGQLTCARLLYGTEGPVDWRALYERRVQCANDCVAFTLAHLIQLFSKLHDPTPIEFPSPLFIYQRAVREMLNGRFVDEGSQFRYILKSAREALVPEALWPEVSENVFLVPPGDLYTEGLVSGITAFYRIPNADECARLKQPPPSVQIDDAMRRGFPVASVMKVNRPYANMGSMLWTGPIPPDGTPEDGYWEGYHAQPIVYSDGDKKGLGCTWGEHLGDEGIFWLSNDAVNRHLAEFWVVQAAPLDL